MSTTVEHTDPRGRKYQARVGENAMMIIVGPPEGLVDDLHLPEPFATTLHNILYERGLYNYPAVSRAPQQLQGALMEAMQLDVQKLMEAYFRFSGGSYD